MQTHPARAGIVKFLVLLTAMGGVLMPASDSLGQTGTLAPQTKSAAPVSGSLAEAPATAAPANPRTPNPAATGQASGWSAPVALGYGWFPVVAADLSGRVHVAWASGSAGYDVVLYTTNADGQTWSETTDIVAYPSTGKVTRPALMADPLGVLHMTFRSSEGNGIVYYSQAPVVLVSPSTMTAHKRISGGYFSSTIRDSKGVLHLIYTEDVLSPTCAICYHIFYLRSVDNGLSWSEPVDISSALQTGAAKPQIIIDQEDNIHVVWESGQGGDLGMLLSRSAAVAYAASYDGGKSWTNPTTLSPDADSASRLSESGGRNITIGLDGEGRLIVVWLGLPEDVVYFQVSDDEGRSWSEPQALPGVWGRWSIHGTRQDSYSMATDSSGYVHLIMVGRVTNNKLLRDNQKSLELLHLVWNKSSWSAPEAIAHFPVFGRDQSGILAGDYPEWPRIAIGNGNQMHLVWFVRDAENLYDSTANYQIWYSRGTSSSPSLAPVVWPTLTPAAPLASPTKSPGHPTPQVTATANFFGEIGSGAYSESAILLVVAKAMIPAAGLVTVAVAAALLWRRWR